VINDMNPPPDLTQVSRSVTLGTAPGSQSIGPSLQAPIGQDGRFQLTGVFPGKYVLRGGGGTLKSAIVNGQDTLDFPLDFTGERDFGDAIITVTDKSTELSGALTDAAGKPAYDCAVIAVSADRRFWTPGSRRIALTQINNDGNYTFRNLPPGDYFVAAIADMEPGAQYDPELLRSLSSAGMRVTLAEGQKLSQNLKLAR